MKKSALKYIIWLLSIALVAASFVLGRNIPFSEQWPLYEALRTTASIIFAVVGAWLAIIYPERLRMSFREKDDRQVGVNGGMSSLFTPIVHSTAILCIILMIGVLAPLLKRVDLLLPYVVLFRGLSYGALTALTLWQLFTVILSFVPADIVKTHTDHEDRHRKTVSGYANPDNYISDKQDSDS